MSVNQARAVSRAERQAQTRERLIAVAREMFLTDGYAATSLDKVALQAGFSKGAVYSNFAGKEKHERESASRAGRRSKSSLAPSRATARTSPRSSRSVTARLSLPQQISYAR